MKTTTALAIALASTVLVGSAGAAAAGGTAKSTGEQPTGGLAQRLAAAPDGTLASEVVGAGTLRLSGADRYETSAEISFAAWAPEDTITVFLASGENYPDALSIGASTFTEGPLLLTRRDALPQATVEELDRLRPCFVVVVGGESAVSDAVAEQADTYTDPAACGL
jgi:putative cell wall-binding protein